MFTSPGKLKTVQQDKTDTVSWVIWRLCISCRGWVPCNAFVITGQCGRTVAVTVCSDLIEKHVPYFTKRHFFSCVTYTVSKGRIIINDKSAQSSPILVPTVQATVETTETITAMAGLPDTKLNKYYLSPTSGTIYLHAYHTAVWV